MEIDARNYATADHFCEHGVYIGNAYGPDYMCNWCESGVSMVELRKMRRQEEILNEKRFRKNISLVGRAITNDDPERAKRINDGFRNHGRFSGYSKLEALGLYVNRLIKEQKEKTSGPQA